MATTHRTELPMNPPVHVPLQIVSERLLVNTPDIHIHIYKLTCSSRRERVLNTTTLEANIQHLKPATKYDFRVVAYNRAGASESPARTTVDTQTEGTPISMLRVVLETS